MSQAIDDLVRDAIVELNQQLPRKQRLSTDARAALFGAGGTLDSLGLVNLVVLVEQRVEDRFGVQLGLTSDTLVGQQPEALATVGAFSQLVARLIEEKRLG